MHHIRTHIQESKRIFSKSALNIEIQQNTVFNILGLFHKSDTQTQIEEEILLNIETADSGSEKTQIFRRLRVFFKPYKVRMLLAFVVLLIAAASALALPVAIRQIVDQGFFVNQQDKINHYFLMILAIVVVMSVFSAARYYLVMWLGERIVADMRMTLYRHMLDMDPLFYETTSTGEVLSRLTTDTTLVQSVVGAGLSVTLRSTLLLLGSLFMLSVTSAKLTGLILLIVPLVVAPIIFFGRRVRRLSRINQDCIAESSALAGETLNAIQLVQAYGLEVFSSERFNASVNMTFSTARQHLKARALLSGIYDIYCVRRRYGDYLAGNPAGHDGPINRG